MEYFSNSPEDTQSFAFSFSKKIKRGQIIALIGDLGSGKTTFSKGFAKGLGIENTVSSPTFKLVSEYHNDFSLFHVDCYRLEDVNEFLIIGGHELLSNSEAIILIEWPEKIKPLWEKDWIYIHFKHDDKNSNKRKITIKDRAK